MVTESSLEHLGFRVLSVLWEGQFTTVFHARDEREGSSGQTVVIKIAELSYNDSYGSDIIRHEAEMLSNFKHDAIVTPIEFLEKSPYVALIFDYFRGKSLREALSKLGRYDDVDAFYQVATQLLKGLCQAHHQQFLHLDIKPENILFEDENYSRARLADWGIATPYQENMVSGAGFTMEYASPEQTGFLKRSLDYTTDIYSLGVTFYEMLAGNNPFKMESDLGTIHRHVSYTPPSLLEVRGNIPQMLDLLIFKMLEKETTRRYQSCDAILHDLSKLRKNSEETFELGELDQARILKYPSQLAGRQLLMEKLLSLFSTNAPSPRLIAFAGESGMGKSSVTEWLAQQINKNSGFILKIEFPENERLAPFYGFLQIAEKWLEHALEKGPEYLENMAQRLKMNLGPDLGVLIQAYPAFQKMFTGPVSPIVTLPPEQERFRVLKVWNLFLSSLSTREAQIVLWFENLNLADVSTLETLFDVLQSHDSPILERPCILATLGSQLPTPEVLTSWWPQYVDRPDSHIMVQMLEPLDNKVISQIIEDAAVFSPSDLQALKEKLIPLSRGNPLFIKILLERMLKERILSFDLVTQSWTLNSDKLRHFSVPENLLGTLVSHLEELEMKDRDILGMCALWRIPFTAEDIAEVFQLDVSDVLHAISEGQYYQILASEQHLFQFAHQNVRQSLIQSLPEPRTRQWNMLIVRHCWNQPDNMDPYLIIHYLEKADTSQLPGDKVIQSYLHAGDKASGMYANAEALRFYQTAWTLLQEGSTSEKDPAIVKSLLLNMAEMEVRLKLPENAQIHYEELLKTSTDSMEQASWFARLSFGYLIANNAATAAEFAKKAIRSYGVFFPSPKWIIPALIVEVLRFVVVNVFLPRSLRLKMKKKRREHLLKICDNSNDFIMPIYFVDVIQCVYFIIKLMNLAAFLPDGKERAKALGYSVSILSAMGLLEKGLKLVDWCADFMRDAGETSNYLLYRSMLSTSCLIPGGMDQESEIRLSQAFEYYRQYQLPEMSNCAALWFTSRVRQARFLEHQDILEQCMTVLKKGDQDEGKDQIINTITSLKLKCQTMLEPVPPEKVVEQVAAIPKPDPANAIDCAAFYSMAGFILSCQSQHLEALKYYDEWYKVEFLKHNELSVRMYFVFIYGISLCRVLEQDDLENSQRKNLRKRLKKVYALCKKMGKLYPGFHPLWLTFQGVHWGLKGNLKKADTLFLESIEESATKDFRFYEIFSKAQWGETHWKFKTAIARRLLLECVQRADELKLTGYATVIRA
ncbi:MAG: protein kinase, partial [SAR324 cluster bacterium]|nr:protein kinase [SAR324 cluster bacterium]